MIALSSRRRLASALNGAAQRPDITINCSDICSGGDIVVEPFLITLDGDARPYTSFQHTGVELIYMLTGRVVYRHADRSYRLEPGDTLFFNAAALHGPQELIDLPMTYVSIIIYPHK
jgi:uncharacterized RmlC-like cupin family protein